MSKYFHKNVNGKFFNLLSEWKYEYISLVTWIIEYKRYLYSKYDLLDATKLYVEMSTYN